MKSLWKSAVIAAGLAMFAIIAPAQADRAWQTGFEIQSAGSSQAANEVTFASGDVVHQTVVVHGGAKALRVSTAGYVQKNGLGNLTQFYTRVYVYLTSHAITPCFLQTHRSTFDSDLFWLSWRSDGAIVLGSFFSNPQTLGTAPAPPLNTWVRVELFANIAGANSSVEVRVDDTPQISVSGVNLSSSAVDRIAIGSQGINQGTDIFYDDACVNNTLGNRNNSWPGPGQIILLSPDSDAGPNNWTPSVAGSHFSLIGEMPFGPTSATFLRSTSRVYGLEDRWGLSDTPADIVSDAVVNAVMFGVYGGNTQAMGGGSRTATVKAYDTLGDSRLGLNQDWSFYFNQGVYPMLTLNGQIGSGAAMTKAYIDGLQASAFETNTGGKAVNWSTVWFTVDYTNP